jgi:murein DD-endopeptidase MepM/ murein hydrolase activator NlpD
MKQISLLNPNIKTKKTAYILLICSLSVGLSGCGSLFGSVDPYRNSYTNWVEDYSTGGALANNSAAYVGRPLTTNVAAAPAVNVNSYAVADTSVYVPAPIQNTQTLQATPLTGQPLTAAALPQTAVTNNQSIKIEPLQSDILIEPVAIVEPTISEPVVQNSPIIVTPKQSKPIEVSAPVQVRESVAQVDILKSSATSKKGRWLWPVDGSKVYRAYDPAKTGSKGALLKASIGSTVRAANGGEIVYVGHDLPGLGNLIIISHDNSLASGYGYVSGISVSEGDTVRQGQAIAKVEGINSQEPVLHFEIRKNNEAVNPVSYIRPR